MTAKAGGFSWGALAPLGAVAIWSGNTIVTKSAATVIDPASITLYRWLIAFALLAPFVAVSTWRARAVVRAHFWQIGILGTLGMATYQGLAYVAARTASAVDMGVIQALMPLFAALMASVLAGEGLTLWALLGSAISLVGVVVLATHGDPAALSVGASGVGDVLMLLAVVANSLYGVLLRRWAIPLSTWQQMLVQMMFAIVISVPFWLAGPMGPINAANAAIVLYAGIPASLGAPFCWIVGVKVLGASRASSFVNLLPVGVALLAWGLLGETLHWYHAIGGGLTLAGVALALRPRRAIRGALVR